MTLFEKAEGSQKLKGFRARIGEIFSGLGLSPNQWTLLSLAMAAIAAALISMSEFVLGAVFIALSGAMDLIDGAVARKTGRVTKEGAYLDTVADRYAEFLYIIPLMFLALPGVFLPMKVWAAAYLFGSMATTYAKAAAKEKDLGIEEIRGGLLERAERVTLLVIGFLLAAVDPLYLSYMVVVLAVLTNISALQRIMKTLELAQSAKIMSMQAVAEKPTIPVTFEKKGAFEGVTAVAKEETPVAHKVSSVENTVIKDYPKEEEKDVESITDVDERFEGEGPSEIDNDYEGYGLEKDKSEYRIEKEMSEFIPPPPRPKAEKKDDGRRRAAL